MYAIYGGDDTSFLPDLEVLESIFPNFGSTVVPGGGHPVHLDDPDLFNSLLIELARNITGGAAGSPTAASPESTSPAGTGSTDGSAGEADGAPAADGLGSAADSDTAPVADDGAGGESEAVPPPASDAAVLGMAELTAVVVGLTVIGLAAVYKIF